MVRFRFTSYYSFVNYAYKIVNKSIGQIIENSYNIVIKIIGMLLSKVKFTQIYCFYAKIL